MPTPFPSAPLSAARGHSPVDTRARFGGAFAAAFSALLLLLPQACRPAPRPEPLVWPPALERGEPAVREQLAAMKERITALESEGERGAELAAAYGQAGQALVAYEAFDVARVAFGNAAALDDGDYRWAYYRALEDLRAQDLPAAEAGFRRAVALAKDREPPFLPAEIQLCRSLRLQEKYTEMTERLWSLLKQPSLGPNGALVRFLLAEEAERIGERADAIRLLEEAVALKPQAGLAHSRLVALYEAEGDEAGAARHRPLSGDAALPLHDPLQQEILEISRASIAWVQRGESFEAAGELPEAEALYRRALELSPGQTLTAVRLARVQVRLGKAQEAIRTLEPLVTQGRPGATGASDLALAGRWLAEARFDAGDPTAALAQIDQSLALAPDEGEILAAKANLLRRRGDCAAAAPVYAQAVAALPTSGLLRVQAALCAYRLEGAAAALNLVDAGLRALPEDAPLSDAKARLLAAAPDDALRDGGAALALAQANAARQRTVDSLQTVAMALAETGRFAEASQVQAEAIQMAKTRGLDNWLAALQAEQLGYSSGRALREPWPAFLYTDG